MPAPVYSIDKFPLDGQFWRVEWFGGISYNPEVPSDPLIEVALALLPTSERDPLSLISRQEWRRRRTEIGVGLLPYVSIGSVWHDQRPVSAPIRHYAKDFLVDTAGVTFKTVGDLIREADVIPRSHYLFSKSWDMARETKVALVRVGDDPFGVIIPVSELIRFYYAPSTRLAQALFWHEYHASFNNEKSGFIGDGLYRLHLRYWMSDSDAWTLARFKESKPMQAYVVRLYQNLQKHRAASPLASASPFRGYRCGFPFVGKSHIRAVCLPLPGMSRGSNRYLALRILRCSAPFPFDELVVDRDNNNARADNAGDEELLQAWKKVPPQETNITEDPEQNKNRFCSDSEPLKSLAPLTVDVVESRFADLEGKHLIKEEKSVQHYRAAPIIGGEAPLLRGLGTGQGTWGASTLRPGTVNVRKPEDVERPAKPTIPATLENFFEAMLHLRTQTGYPVHFLSSVSGDVEYSDSPACLRFPTFDPGARKRIKWSLVPGHDALRPRELAIADVSVSGQHCYVLEIERTNDEYAVLLMARHDLSPVAAEDWSSFLLRCANKKRWMSEEEMPEYRRLRTTHNGLVNTNVLAYRIKSKIDELLGFGSEPDGPHSLQPLPTRDLAANAKSLDLTNADDLSESDVSAEAAPEPPMHTE